MKKRTVHQALVLTLALTTTFVGPAQNAQAHGSGGFPAPGRGVLAPDFDTGTFVNFETPHVSPLAINAAGDTLVACNTADNRLEVFSVSGVDGSLTYVQSIPVGYSPVSVRYRTNTEAWVVNHLSDTVSVVDLSLGHVTDTIATDDEPADVVFTSDSKALVSCSRPDVIQIFNATTHAFINQVAVLGEDPRAMASGPMGNNVYTAIFDSGNSTTIINTTGVTNGVADGTNPYNGTQNPPFNNGIPGSAWDTPSASNSSVTPTAPAVALIVRKDFGDGDKWKDDNGADWTKWVTGTSASTSGRITGWDMIDNDVVMLSIGSSFLTPSYVTRKMNACMSIATNPVTGEVVMVGTEATNEIRFEPNITGTFIRVLVSITDSAGSFVALEDLNEVHLDAAQSGGGTAYEDGTVLQADRDKSIGDPRGIAFNTTGTEMFVTGMGSNNVVVLDASTGLRLGVTGYTINVGQGPTGIVHHPTQNRVYTLNKFDGSISVINDSGAPGAESVMATVSFYDPTPGNIQAGRVQFYNTHLTSGLGQIACASCHVDSRMDRLAWDLGDPDGATKSINPVSLISPGAGEHNEFLSPDVDFEAFHFMKGPMTTQTLQDIIGHEPLHWRGDRDGIEEFAGAFSGLQGRDAPLEAAPMQDFENFLATIHFPPNPFRNIDNSLPGGPTFADPFGPDTPNLPLPFHFAGGLFAAEGTPLPDGDAYAGFQKYVFKVGGLDGGLMCTTCHTLPSGGGSPNFFTGALNADLVNPSLYVPIPPGPNGEAHRAIVAVDGTGQPHIKTAHLRNQLDKVGFTLMPDPGMGGAPRLSRSGFGVLHDGSVDGLDRFIQSSVFSVTSDQEVADLAAFTLAINGDDFTDLFTLPGAPPLFNPPGGTVLTAHAAIGQQITINTSSPTMTESDRINLLVALADDDKVDIIVKGTKDSDHRGWYRLSGSPFQSDINDETNSLAELISFAGVGTELTFTVVPETSGIRMGVDRDEDGAFDFSEILAGTDPNDPLSGGLGMPAARKESNTLLLVLMALAGFVLVARFRPLFGRK